LLKSFVVLLGLASAAVAGSPEFERARTLYNQTDFDQSLKILQAIPVKDPAVNALMGRDYYMQGEYKKASELLEKAFGADPQNAEYALWLGRAFGRRAETASPFTAPGYASKARQYFEKSAQLNPRDLDALDDLFEYYLEAPGFLGGGIDKAQTIADQMGRLNSSNGYFAEARIAERRKQYSTAEAHLRRAVELAPHQVDRLIDLARFLSKQGRIPESDQSLARADQIAPNLPRLMYAKAEMYIQSGRNLDLAKELLQRYLTCSLTPDDPPRSDATKLLRQAQERARNGHGG
jgi:tetratricopeptide (TPR) repeat protein